MSSSRVKCSNTSNHGLYVLRDKIKTTCEQFLFATLNNRHPLNFCLFYADMYCNTLLCDSHYYADMYCNTILCDSHYYADMYCNTLLCDSHYYADMYCNTLLCDSHYPPLKSHKIYILSSRHQSLSADSRHLQSNKLTNTLTA